MEKQFILYIEDDSIDRLALARFFAKVDNYLPFEYVDSISSAKDFLNKYTPSLIITDWNLGDGTAMDILSLSLNIPIIVLTGGGDEVRAAKAIKNGAFDYLVKDLNRTYLPQLPDLINQAITKQRELSRLKTLAHRFQQMADHAPVMIWIADTTKSFTYFNRSWIEFRGTKLKDEIEKTWLDSIHKSDYEDYINIYNDSFKTLKEFEVEYRLLRYDGSYRWLLNHATPMFDEKKSFIGYIGTCIDITDRKQIEISLKNSELRFRSMSEASLMGIFLTNSKGHCTYVNPTYINIRGISFEECLGEGWANGIYQEDKERVYNSWYQAAKNKADFQSIHRFIRPDGKIIWCNVKAAPFLNENLSGNIVEGYVGSVEDITSKKEAEEKLAQTNKTLLESEERLQLALKETKAASEARSRFLANMSHEIRTPLTAIIGFSEALKDHSIDTDERSKIVDTILKNGLYLMDVINDILDISKIEANALNVESIPISPISIVEEVKTMMLPRIKDKPLSLFINYQWPLPDLINSDPLRLKQIIVNLLGNAVKFTDKGWVELRMSYDDEAKELLFAISDSGIGMTEEHIKAIFQPFSQADGSTTRRFGGTGLGLTICSHLINKLSGKIKVESSYGVGSVFSFNIPSKLDSPPKMISKIPFVESTSTSFTEELLSIKGDILVADDAIDNQKLLSHFLKKTSAKATFVDNGEKALLSVKNNNYDLILMDMQMPIMDGYTATKEIRNLGIAIPIIAITANNMTHDILKCMEAGCSFVLGKPFKHDLFYRTLRQFLSN